MVQLEELLYRLTHFRAFHNQLNFFIQIKPPDITSVRNTDYGFGYKSVYFYDDKFSKPVQMYRGENAIYKFMEKILEEVVDCKKTVRM